MFQFDKLLLEIIESTRLAHQLDVSSQLVGLIIID